MHQNIVNVNKIKYEGFIFKIKPTNKLILEHKRLRDLILPSRSKLKVYFDTCIFGMTLDQKIKGEDASSLRRIMENKKDFIESYTSEKTKKEVSRHGDISKKDYLYFIISFFKIIPEENYTHFKDGSIGSFPVGSIPLGCGIEEDDSLLTQLKGLFDFDDSEQIFQAIKSRANYFLTIDNNTILSKRKEFNKMGFSLKLVSPKNLENILFSEEDNTE